MASTVHEPPQIDSHRLPETDHSGSGGWRNLVPADGDLRVVQHYSPPASSTGIWVVLFAITMMFAAFTSTGRAQGRVSRLAAFHLAVHPLFQHSSAPGQQRDPGSFASPGRCFHGRVRSQSESPARWLYMTLSLGLLFVAGQYIAWRQLSAQGLFLATNPSSSFFYVLTAAHALHILGGLGGIGAKPSQIASKKNGALHATNA